MVYITQLIYINSGKESIFNEFEAMAIPIISKYNGRLLLRCKPGEVLEAGIEIPYELHIISFPSHTDFQQFIKDEVRKSFLHLKEQSVRTSLLICGEKIG